MKLQCKMTISKSNYAMKTESQVQGNRIKEHQTNERSMDCMKYEENYLAIVAIFFYVCTWPSFQTPGQSSGQGSWLCPEYLYVPSLHIVHQLSQLHQGSVGWPARLHPLEAQHAWSDTSITTPHSIRLSALIRSVINKLRYMRDMDVFLYYLVERLDPSASS